MFGVSPSRPRGSMTSKQGSPQSLIQGLKQALFCATLPCATLPRSEGRGPSVHTHTPASVQVYRCGIHALTRAHLQAVYLEASRHPLS